MADGTNEYMFKSLSTSNTSYARSGELNFGDTNVLTPTFMPVATQGSVKGLTMDQVRSTGVGIVLGNTYHLHLQPGEDLIDSEGGLAKFTKWHGPMLTDSGGFQVFSLSGINRITEEGVWFSNPKNGDEIFLSPEISMQIQHKIGADIIMAFDDVVSLTTEKRARTREAMDRTHRWLERCVAEHARLSKDLQKPPKLFGIVQGGLDKAMRKESLEFVQSQPVDGIAIGGLSVGESRGEMHEMLEYLAPLYDSQRPRYLMGVGHPIDVRFGIEHGIDMFDCVLPTRNARHGSFWLFEDNTDVQHSIKKQHFLNRLEPIEGDSIVSEDGYSYAYIRHLVRTGQSLGGQLLSIHNIRYLQKICEQYQHET